jgi:hypothetical protein
MSDKTIHYRVRDLEGRIVARGCGATGMSGSIRTRSWDDVTCGNCKRSKEWKEARGASTPLPSTEQPE